MTDKPYRILRKAGRCLSGAERDGGVKFHAVLPGKRRAVCGDVPQGQSVGWASVEGEKVTCPRCLTKLPWPPTPAFLMTQGFGGQHDWAVVVVGETAQKYRIRPPGNLPEHAVKLGGRDRWLRPGEQALVPKDAIRFTKCDLLLCRSGLPARCNVNENMDDASFSVQICDECAGILGIEKGDIPENANERLRAHYAEKVKA